MNPRQASTALSAQEELVALSNKIDEIAVSIRDINDVSVESDALYMASEKLKSISQSIFEKTPF